MHIKFTGGCKSNAYCGADYTMPIEKIELKASRLGEDDDDQPFTISGVVVSEETYQYVLDALTAHQSQGIINLAMRPPQEKA